MKNLFMLLLPLIVFSGILVGFTTTQEDHDAFKNNNGENIVNKIETIQNSVEELSKTLVNNKNNFQKINRIGSEIANEWDVIDTTIEDQYPDEFTKLHRSLFPIITLATEATPYTHKLKKLIGPAQQSLERFQKNISS
ncbi:hypothetical protein [Aquibacillus rhizosphaerae]|uniref:Uncharacterized protein n=1 Tax=Aquibacillus rhizosphaerae TaxID=3051431 RepID=A0ABT7LB45_9BACI|nr:hypothetical protein [Aquibacillus sp. LR5S19]MDL4843077.1 hypothetical protein [Aquibacillus sp. LR5S19]